jgi:hypothetical protein
MDLYERTGFPQRVQGKRGENKGESHILGKLFIFILLQCFRLDGTGTRSVVWDPKCALCTIGF